MNLTKKKITAILSQIKFIFSFSPQIDLNKDSAFIYVPSGYKAVVLISADFEMAWASRYSKNHQNPLQHSISAGQKTRDNLPIILDLCDKYQLPVTWATVGHLFLERCENTNPKHQNISRLSYFENQYWKFTSGDWFDYDPCTDVKSNPEWYAPDLIKDIISRRVKHEIGCHTFSHIDCSDRNCPNEVFDSEIHACKEIAESWGLKLKSFVHPGHTIGHISNLVMMGFTSFRSDTKDTLGYPIRHKSGIWELRNSAQIEYRFGWSYSYHVWRLSKIIQRAVKTNTVCNLWFHPQINDKEFVSVVFEGLFRFIDKNRNNIWVTTMQEYTAYLNGQV